ncbi:MAG: diaminopimelate decarboxylase [Calditrichaeota bacterium]|nr:diaminopimelate decarboxylase [Calditrichota bacterium]
MFTPEIVQKLSRFRTPFYYYDVGLLRETLETLCQAAEQYDVNVHYALKANAEPHLLSIIREYGLGADCVSGNEIQRALEVGFPPEAIVFAGVGKTDLEIEHALEADIFCLNVESLQELQVIAELARLKDRIASVALRINPNVEAGTHEYITTGREEDKFGIPWKDVPAAVELLQQTPHLRFLGIHFHIGSQITDLNVFKRLCLRVNDIQRWFRQQGLPVLHLNLGGGLGIDYDDPDAHPIPDFASYFQIFDRYLERRADQTLHFELGRSVVGQCGALITRVLYVKQGVERRYAIVDAGMTELIRPALYGAYHQIDNLTAEAGRKSFTYDVVGPVCESSDFLGKDVSLAEVRRGDLLAIRSAGAYAAVMASQYNLRDPAGVVFSDML